MTWMPFTVAAAFGFGIFLFVLMVFHGQSALRDYREIFTETARTNMADAFLFVDPNRLFLYNVVALAVIPVTALLATQSLLVTLLAFVLVLVVPQFYYRHLRKRRLKQFEKLLPDALSMVAGSLRAGASLTLALEGLVREMPAPINQEFELFLREQRLGMDFETAIHHMEERLPITDFSLVVAALRISREVGGNLTEVMDSLATTLRTKSMMEGKIQSLTAQGKMQGMVMAGLPIFLGLLLMQLEPEAMGKLFTTNTGYAVLAVIVVMETLGFITIKKVTTIDV